MKCPVCNTNLPMVKIILNGTRNLKCPACNSHLRISGIDKAEAILVIICCLAFFIGSWITFVLSLMFVFGAFVILVNMFVSVAVVDQ
jgi:hypothetical protein